jgi:hypothetical protein
MLEVGKNLDLHLNALAPDGGHALANAGILEVHDVTLRQLGLSSLEIYTCDCY